MKLVYLIAHDEGDATLLSRIVIGIVRGQLLLFVIHGDGRGEGHYMRNRVSGKLLQSWRGGLQDFVEDSGTRERGVHDGNLCAPGIQAAYERAHVGEAAGGALSA